MMHSVTSMNRPATASIVVVGLWIVQILLAALFAFSGAFKLITPIEEMPLAFVLPGLLHIRPNLTPLAARGLVLLMVGAVMFTPPDALALALLPAVVGLLAAIVAYGRTRVAPYDTAAAWQATTARRSTKR